MTLEDRTEARLLHEGVRTNRYLWLTLLCAGVYAAALCSVRPQPGYPPVKGWWLLGVLGLAVANAAARTWAAWRRGGFNLARLAWCFNAVDAGLISAGVRVSGGEHSELWLLYFVLVASEAPSSPRYDALALWGLVIAGYAVGTWSPDASAAYYVTAGLRLAALALVGAFAHRVLTVQEQRHRELRALRETVAVGEERARIAREVHDGLGHALAAALLRLEVCVRTIRTDPHEAETILREEVGALRSAWSQARDLAFHLRPWTLEGERFSTALQRSAGRFAARTGLVVEVNASDDADALSADQTSVLVGIVQESLTNVIRHAQASRVWITVGRCAGAVVCTVRDDGVGPQQEQAEAGSGLASMRERAASVGGELTFGSNPDGGAVVSVSLPAR